MLALIWLQRGSAKEVLQPGSDPIEATFELNDTLYAKAHIPPTEEVYLWLGVSLA
jgi:hypothetical protein